MPIGTTNAAQPLPISSRQTTRSNPLGLTRREAQILALLSDGLRNSVIAKRLFLSTTTIDHHVSAILAKLGVQSRAEAVTPAWRLPEGDGTELAEGIRTRLGDFARGSGKSHAGQAASDFALRQPAGAEPCSSLRYRQPIAPAH
jgi:DNA-binding CsgD family transcriptional regulator